MFWLRELVPIGPKVCFERNDDRSLPQISGPSLNAAAEISEWISIEIEHQPAA